MMSPLFGIRVSMMVKGVKYPTTVYFQLMEIDVFYLELRFQSLLFFSFFVLFYGLNCISGSIYKLFSDIVVFHKYLIYTFCLMFSENFIRVCYRQ